MPSIRNGWRHYSLEGYILYSLNEAMSKLRAEMPKVASIHDAAVLGIDYDDVIKSMQKHTEVLCAISEIEEKFGISIIRNKLRYLAKEREFYTAHQVMEYKFSFPDDMYVAIKLRIREIDEQIEELTYELHVKENSIFIPEEIFT